MSQEFDQLNSRKAQRYSRQQARLARQQRSRRNLIIGLCLFAVIVLVAGVLLWRNWEPAPQVQVPSGTTGPSSTAPSTAPLPTQPLGPETVITLTAAGDLNITDLSVAAGEQNGVYDFGPCFRDVAGLFAQADVSLLNLEGNLCGTPYGTDRASAPQELLQALKSAGVDMVQTANSYTVHNGLTGLSQTLNSIRSAGLEPLGAYGSSQEAQASQGFTIKEIGGIRVAIVAFTKGVGGLGLPAGSEDRVNLLYSDYSSAFQKVNTEGINRVLAAVRAQKPDVTIAMLHWGSEFNDARSATQDEIETLMLEGGVDAIIGTHPHYVQPVRFDAAKGQVVADSLGDFFGDGQKAGTNYSILLQLQITRNNETGETKITGCEYVPIYLLTPERDGEPMRVVRIREAMEMYENNHVSKVSQQAYENMKNALARIEARVKG